jgi:hypothetical protein
VVPGNPAAADPAPDHLGTVAALPAPARLRVAAAPDRAPRGMAVVPDRAAAVPAPLLHRGNAHLSRVSASRPAQARDPGQRYRPTVEGQGIMKRLKPRKGEDCGTRGPASVFGQSCMSSVTEIHSIRQIVLRSKLNWRAWLRPGHSSDP